MIYGGFGIIIGVVLFFVVELKIVFVGGGGVVVLVFFFKYLMLGFWGFLIYMFFVGIIIYWIGGGSFIF